MLRQRVALALLLGLSVWSLYSCLGVGQWFQGGAEPEPDLFAPADLEPIVEQAVTLVEEHFGVAFRRRPSVVPIARKALHVALRREEYERLAALAPDTPSGVLARRAHENVGLLPWVWGMYSGRSHTVFLLRKVIEFDMWRVGYIPTAKPKALKLLLVHELAHAMDHELYDASEVRELPDEEAHEAYAAVTEGHAEFVMRRVAERCGDWSIAEDWIAGYAHYAAPALTFRYARGREFIEALAARGELRMDAVYAQPPRTRAQILKPETYP